MFLLPGQWAVCSLILETIWQYETICFFWGGIRFVHTFAMRGILWLAPWRLDWVYLISQIFGIRAVEAMASMEMAQNRGVTASSCTLITWDWSSKSQETGSKTMDRLFNQHSIRFMEPWKTSEVHQISSDVLSRVDVKSDIAPRLGLTTGFPPLSPCHVFVPLPANLRMVLQGSQGWPGLRLTVLHWIWFITMESTINGYGYLPYITETL